jgi:drug/metabolite transporter superfamily protein YnfA
MRVYHERLRVPASWWVAGLITAVLLGTAFMAQFSWLLAGVVYAGLGGVWAVALLIWGWTSVDVRDGALLVGPARLPLAASGQVTALDQAQTSAMRGPRADPAAFLLARPYLPRAVYVEVIDAAQGRPYWLVGTRRPDELAAAIEAWRQAAHTGGAPVG